MLLALGMLVAVPASADAQSGCVDASAPVAEVGVDRAEAAVICLINELRLARGLATYAPDDRLHRAALAHSQDEVARNYFSHTGQDGSTPQDRARRAGYRWLELGENIASGQTTPEGVVQDWMASPSHCDNLLTPHLRDIGIGLLPEQPTWTVLVGAEEGDGFADGPTGPSDGCWIGPDGQRVADTLPPANTAVWRAVGPVRAAITRQGSAIVLRVTNSRQGSSTIRITISRRGATRRRASRTIPGRTTLDVTELVPRGRGRVTVVVERPVGYRWKLVKRRVL